MPFWRETKRIKMMMHSTTRKIDVLKVEINDVSRNFQFKTEVSKVERETLLSLPNLNYESVLIVLKQTVFARVLARDQNE